MFPAHLQTSIPPSVPSRSHAFLAGPPVASDQLLPNEVWRRIHALADLPAKSAMTRVDTNLRNFALPTAQAHLSAAFVPSKRYEHGTRLVRQAVAVLRHEFTDPADRDRHVRQLVVLAAGIGPHWSDRKSFDILQAALCGVLPRLPPALQRHVLTNLAAVNQRGCATFADPESHSLVNHGALAEWRNDLQRRHEQLRTADTAINGVLGAESWQRLDRRMVEWLGGD